MKSSICEKEIFKKSQSWSIDVVLGVIIFMAAFLIFYALLNANPNAKVSNLKDEASIIIKQLVSGNTPPRIVDGNEINVSRVSDLKNLDYEELKRRLRVGSDFCIYIEDDKGNIVLINYSYKGVGAPNINLGDTPCSQK